MPDLDPAQFAKLTPAELAEEVRVKDNDTGHKLTIRRAALGTGNYTVLKQDAVGADGLALPPEHKGADTTQTKEA